MAPNQRGYAAGARPDPAEFDNYRIDKLIGDADQVPAQVNACCWSTSPATPPNCSNSGAGGVEGGDRVAIEGALRAKARWLNHADSGHLRSVGSPVGLDDLFKWEGSDPTALTFPLLPAPEFTRS